LTITHARDYAPAVEANGTMRGYNQWCGAVTAAMWMSVLAAGSSWAQAAGTPAVALLNASDSVRDALRRIQEAKKPVELVLKNGKSYRGMVGGVGDHTVVVTEIEGKEFYDVLIQLEDVSAIEVRARGESNR
jgi:hypothetical protein